MKIKVSYESHKHIILEIQKIRGLCFKTFRKEVGLKLYHNDEPRRSNEDWPEGWFDVEGDIDDFVFFDDSFNQSER